MYVVCRQATERTGTATPTDVDTFVCFDSLQVSKPTAENENENDAASAGGVLDGDAR